MCRKWLYMSANKLPYYSNKKLPEIAALATLLLLNYLIWSISKNSFISSTFFVLAFFIFSIIGIIRSQGRFIVAIFLFAGVVITVFSGTTDWDARSIWLFHAKRIFINDSFYAQLDNYAPWSHNDYPVFYPVVSATIASVVGHWAESFPKIASVFILTPSVLLLSIFFKQKYFSLVLAGILAICGTSLFNGYVDAIVAVYSLAALFCCHTFLFRAKEFSEKDSYLLLFLFGYFCLSLMLLKNEGMLLSMLLVSLAIVFGSSDFRRRLIIVFLAVFTIYMLTWRLPILVSGLQSGLFTKDFLGTFFTRISGFDSTYLVFRYFFYHTYISFILIIISLYGLRKDLRQALFFLCFLGLYASALLMVYFGTPYDLEWHLRTSIERTMLTFNVCSLGFFIACLVGRFENAKAHKAF